MFQEHVNSSQQHFKKVVVYVNTSNTQRVMFIVHNKRQVYVPDMTKLYGSFSRVVEFPPIQKNMANGRLRYYEITKEHLIALNNPKELCDSNNRQPDTEKCIQGTGQVCGAHLIVSISDISLQIMYKVVLDAGFLGTNTL